MKYRKNAVWAVAMLHAPDYLLLLRTDFGRFIGCPTWPDESAPPFFVGEGNIALAFVSSVLLPMRSLRLNMVFDVPKFR